MELLETYAFKFPRRISLRSKLAPKEGRLAKQAVFLLPCVDEKDAKSFVARKERNVCKGNLSRVYTVGSADCCVLRTQQSGACLKTGSLLPPLAAQRLFPLAFQ